MWRIPSQHFAVCVSKYQYVWIKIFKKLYFVIIRDISVRFGKETYFIISYNFSLNTFQGYVQKKRLSHFYRFPLTFTNNLT